MWRSQSNRLVTEIEFEKQVVEVAHQFGWLVAGFRAAGGGSQGWRTPVKYDGKGWPDLTLIHVDGYVIFAELKRDKGSKIYPEQVAWGEALSLVEGRSGPSVIYRLWKPKDLPEIVSTLSFGRATVGAVS
jgi:hypothetical protein